MSEDIVVKNFKGYMGSETIKRTGVKIEWTKEKILEYARCAADPIYFGEKYMKIVNLNKGLITIPLYDYQKELISTAKDNRFVIAEQCRQSGKALPLDTKIPTPNGWTTMGAIQPNDLVFDENGKPTKVESISKTFFDHDCYKITFDDNTSVDADAEHLWVVKKSSKKNQNEIKLTTKKLFDSGVTFIDSRGKTVSKWKIPLSKPVQYSSKPITIDAYILGLWLGDGSAADGRITSSFEDFDFYKTLDVEFSHNHSKRNLYTGTIYGLSPKLKALNLINNKHIPSDYLFNSIETRIKLLQGLMDSDGTVEKSGRLCLSFSYSRYANLIENSYELLVSLGLKVSRKEYPKTNSCRLYFNCPREKFDVFKLPRKLEKQNLTQKRYDKVNHRYIRKIEKIESVPTKCISVENESHLFLCSENFIPTHNTTAVTVFVLWRMIFHEHESVAILANKQETSIEILSRIQLAYEHLPVWLQQGVVTWNKKSFELENGSKILAAATSAGNIRGKSVKLLIIDEAAHIEGWDDFYTSVYPVISSGEDSKFIMISTVNGLNHFHEFTNGSRTGRNDFKLVSVPWWRVPGRDTKWKETTLKNMNGDLEKFAQEYENEYLGSSGTLINGSRLKKMAEHVHTVIPVNSYEDQVSGLKQYVMATPGRSYVLIADCSQGKGLDYSAFSIIDVTDHPYEQVCTYRNNMITPTEYSEIINRMALVYNRAMILVELNDVGALVANLLIDNHECENMLYTKHAGKMGKHICVNMPNSEPGVRTTKSVKATGCSMIKLIIEQEKLIINDSETVNEFSTFSKHHNSWAAEAGKNDDLVMGLVIFGWLSDQKYFKEFTNIDSLKIIRDQPEDELEADLLIFGDISEEPKLSPLRNYTKEENWKIHLNDKGFNTDNWLDSDTFEDNDPFVMKYPF